MKTIFMKRRIPLFLLIVTVFPGMSVSAQSPGMRGLEGEPPPMHDELLVDDLESVEGSGKLGRAFERRLETAVHNEIITAGEAAQLRKQKADLDAYRVEVWKDEVMTRTERDTLARKSDELRRVVQEVFRRAMERRRAGAGGRGAFRKRIWRAVSKGDITQAQADRLVALHDDLVRAREAVWTDNQMTRAEREELAQKARAFREAVREAFNREPRPELRGSGRPRRHGEQSCCGVRRLP